MIDKTGYTSTINKHYKNTLHMHIKYTLNKHIKHKINTTTPAFCKYLNRAVQPGARKSWLKAEENKVVFFCSS